jgi:outer membrane protein assembly factor BamB
MKLSRWLVACLFLFSGSIHAQSGKYDWPGWRNADRSGVSKETGLLKQWPEGGPKVVWEIKGIGGGYSTPSVAQGKVFGMGYVGGKEVVWAIGEEDGKPVWQQELGPQGNAGYNEGPRSTPTIDGEKLYVVGIGGDLVCMKTDTGSILWRKNYQNDFKGRMMSGWGFCESVLVDGDKVIATPGGDDAAIVALNKDTGATIWKSKIPNGGGAGYASPIKATLGSVSMYITLLGKSGGVVAVEANKGTPLWQYNKIANGTANIPTVIYRDGIVFASTGYGDGGTAVLQLVKGGKGVTYKELKYYKSGELQNHHGGMVLIGDYVYLGRAHNNGFPTCVEFKTGKIAWKEDRGPGSGSAALSAADGMLYFRYENGLVSLVEANPKEYVEVSKFKLAKPSGKPSWPHPVIANGKLIIRDQDLITAYDIKAK